MPFFRKGRDDSKVEVDVGETAHLKEGQTGYTNASAQCITVVTTDEYGRRTVSHVSPYGEDNAYGTEDPNEIARIWLQKVGHQGGEVLLAGGRRGVEESEALHAALVKMARRGGFSIEEDYSLQGYKDITNVESTPEGTEVRTNQKSRWSLFGGRKKSQGTYSSSEGEYSYSYEPSSSEDEKPEGYWKSTGGGTETWVTRGDPDYYRAPFSFPDTTAAMLGKFDPTSDRFDPGLPPGFKGVGTRYKGK